MVLLELTAAEQVAMGNMMLQPNGVHTKGMGLANGKGTLRACHRIAWNQGGAHIISHATRNASGLCGMPVGCVECQWVVWNASGLCGMPMGCVECQWAVWNASGLCGMPVGCVECQWAVWNASGLCGMPMGCVDCQWAMWIISGLCGRNVSGLCGMPVGCAEFQWAVRNASGLCGLSVGCVECQWAVAPFDGPVFLPVKGSLSVSFRAALEEAENELAVGVRIELELICNVYLRKLEYCILLGCLRSI